jgi:hypothetical protein
MTRKVGWNNLNKQSKDISTFEGNVAKWWKNIFWTTED